jgi:hypothetical protein
MMADFGIGVRNQIALLPPFPPAHFMAGRTDARIEIGGRDTAARR